MVSIYIPPVLFTAHFESVQRKLILLLHVQHEIAAAAAAAGGDGTELWLLHEGSNIQTLGDEMRIGQVLAKM